MLNLIVQSVSLDALLIELRKVDRTAALKGASAALEDELKKIMTVSSVQGQHMWHLPFRPPNSTIRAK